MQHAKRRQAQAEAQAAPEAAEAMKNFEPLVHAMADMAAQPNFHDIARVHTLHDGRGFIPAQQIMEWPKPMRDWIEHCNVWKPSINLDGYVSAQVLVRGDNA